MEKGEEGEGEKRMEREEGREQKKGERRRMKGEEGDG